MANQPIMPAPPCKAYDVTLHFLKTHLHKIIYIPADNAPIESFHSTLKSETFYLEGLTCTTTAIVEQTVRDYIHYYNSIRIQTKLNNQSPMDYRRLAA